MARSDELTQIVQCMIACMVRMSASNVSAAYKNIAKTPEFKTFHIKISQMAAPTMNPQLKLALRENEVVLCAEKEARTTRKRAASSNRNEKNAKRPRKVSAAEKEVLQQGQEEDDEEVSPKNETPGPQPDSQCYGMAHRDNSPCEKDGETETEHHESEEPNEQHADDQVSAKNETPCPQPDSQCYGVAHPDDSPCEKDGETETENHESEETNAEHAFSKPSSMASASGGGSHEAEEGVSLSSFEIDSGLICGLPKVVTYVKNALLALEAPTMRSSFNILDETAKIWKIVLRLNFFKVRHELHQHLESREKVTDDALRARTNWNISDPSEIFEALEKVKRSTIDNKIHRAYGQMMLFSAVNEEVAGGIKSIATSYRSNHKTLLEELARKKAGSVSKTELDQIISKYFYEYYAGQKWLAVVNWFGGSGIVPIFVIAGIGSWYVETGWTEFQRTCVEHIAGLLHSVRRLVENLGPDALGLYCRHGRLGNDCLERVKQTELTLPDNAEEDSEDETE